MSSPNNLQTQPDVECGSKSEEIREKKVTNQNDKESVEDQINYVWWWILNVGRPILAMALVLIVPYFYICQVQSDARKLGKPCTNYDAWAYSHSGDWVHLYACVRSHVCEDTDGSYIASKYKRKTINESTAIYNAQWPDRYPAKTMKCMPKVVPGTVPYSYCTPVPLNDQREFMYPGIKTDEANDLTGDLCLKDGDSCAVCTTWKK